MNVQSKVIGIGLGTIVAISALALAQAKTSVNTPVNTTQVANRLINECAGIRHNELVWLSGGVRDAQLLEDLAIQTRQLGAHPFITLESDRLVRKMFTDVPAKFDNQLPKVELEIAKSVDAIISVDFTDQDDLLADVKSERIIASAKAQEPVYKKLFERGVVNVHLGNGLYPTQSRAQRYGITKQQLEEIFWNGINVDYQQLQTIGANVRNKLSGGKNLTITAPNGTNLKLQITKQPVFISDGVVSSEDRYEGGPACQAWLPAGEVYLAPVAGTAEGTFVADNFFYEGKYIEKLTLNFSKGKLTSWSATGNMSNLQARYDAAPTGKEVFSALDIGINPNITVPTGSKMATWMASGSITIGIGNNLWAGGNNDVPFDVFAHLTNGTLTVDGRKLVDQGKLLTK